MLADVVFQLAPDGIERFPDRCRQSLFGLPICRQLVPRHYQPDPYVEWTAFARVVDRRFDGHIVSLCPT
jgi:hypothetical protein